MSIHKFRLGSDKSRTLPYLTWLCFCWGCGTEIRTLSGWYIMMTCTNIPLSCQFRDHHPTMFQYGVLAFLISVPGSGHQTQSFWARWETFRKTVCNRPLCVSKTRFPSSCLNSSRITEMRIKKTGSQPSENRRCWHFRKSGSGGSLLFILLVLL